MTTRRPQAQDYSEVSASVPEKTEDSDVSPAIPVAVIYKLLAFTAAMIVAPIGAYFLTVDSVFKGNSTFSGITAAVVANVILVAYILVAWREDQSDRLAEGAKRKGKKAQ